MPPHPTSLKSVLILSFHLHLFPLLVAHRRTSPSPRPCEMFRNIVSFCGEALLAPRATPKLVDHPLSAVRDCLFNIFTSTLHIAGVPPSATWGRSMLWWQGPTYPAPTTRQRVSTGTHHYGHLVVECFSETALSDGNWRDLTACYLPLSKFRTSFLGQTCC